MHSSLFQCSSCSSFTPRSHSSCVHCGTTLKSEDLQETTENRLEANQQREVKARSRFSKIGRSSVEMAGVALVSMTLSACYGGGPEGYNDSYYEPLPPGGNSIDDAEPAPDQSVMPEPVLPLPETCSDLSLDLDEDGYCGDQDCDENNPFVHDNCNAGGMNGGWEEWGGSSMGGATSGGSSMGGSTSGGSSMGGATSGGSSMGGSTSGGEVMGGSTSGGEVMGGSTSGGEVMGGATSGGEVMGGASSGGSSMGGATSGGNSMGGATSGGEMMGGGNSGGEVMGGSTSGGEMNTPGAETK